MNKEIDLSIILLHENMLNKEGKLITTSLTMIDSHDISRSSRTYQLSEFFIAHPSNTLQDLANTLKKHWVDGYGAKYNTNRGEALELITIVDNYEQAKEKIKTRTGKTPKIIATSAKTGENRIGYSDLKEELKNGDPYLLLLGTGWGLSDSYLSEVDFFLAPILGPGDYNHLSVRSAAAIMLDRLFGS